MKRRIVPSRRFQREETAMHGDPRFWALVAAMWIGLFLAVVNIATKIDLFMRLSG
ncbi:MAG: hypothetical protein WB816_00125 [Methylocystis sp.]